ncbi:Carbonic anhydrase 2 [Halotydeus destructor]|nr:Carbonic anhydrase 2 [Halotydeus destructor]
MTSSRIPSLLNSNIVRNGCHFANSSRISSTVRCTLSNHSNERLAVSSNTIGSCASTSPLPLRTMASQVAETQLVAEDVSLKRPGPPEWAEKFPIALNGVRQSPIDIQTTCCSSTQGLPPLIVHWPDAISGCNMTNGGYGWRVDIPAEAQPQTSVTGGPLKDKYILEQFHAHWGSDCSCGSEHTVDGQSFAAELHLVHWNADKFGSFFEAASNDKGLAVLGMLLQVGAEAHPEFDKVIKHMSDIQYKGQSVPLSDSLNIENFLPLERGYWTYEGSLTTPPLYESVQWIVFKQPVVVSQEQLEKCRDLRRHECDNIPESGEHKVDTCYRPPQPLCDRSVASVQ